MKVDNRWAVGVLEETIPENAKAVYGARWIDHDTWMDIVPDRQGFAYDDERDREVLILKMEAVDLRHRATGLNRDIVQHVVNDPFTSFHCWMRRAGGYVYVTAWIE